MYGIKRDILNWKCKGHGIDVYNAFYRENVSDSTFVCCKGIDVKNPVTDDNGNITGYHCKTGGDPENREICLHEKVPVVLSGNINEATEDVLDKIREHGEILRKMNTV